MAGFASAGHRVRRLDQRRQAVEVTPSWASSAAYLGGMHRRLAVVGPGVDVGEVEDRGAQTAGQHPLRSPVAVHRVTTGTDAEPRGRGGRRVRRGAPLPRAADPPGHRPPRRVVAVRRARPGRARSRGGSCRGRRPRCGRRSAARSARGSARRNGRSRPAAWRCRRTPPSRRGRAPRGGIRPSRRRHAGPRPARYDAAPTADRRPRRPHASGSVPVLFSSRSCSRARTSSGVICVRWRWSRAITTPVAATPARPASPSHFHSFTR